jgi:hypothetical protein
MNFRPRVAPQSRAGARKNFPPAMMLTARNATVHCPCDERAAFTTERTRPDSLPPAGGARRGRPARRAGPSAVTSAFRAEDGWGCRATGPRCAVMNRSRERRREHNALVAVLSPPALRSLRLRKVFRAVRTGDPPGLAPQHMSGNSFLCPVMIPPCPATEPCSGVLPAATASIR